MRSRYSAFAVLDLAYLLKSWHSSTRPTTLDLEPTTRWTGLTILGTTDGSAFHTEGTVEFEARYVDHGDPGVLTEHSSFAREDGDWVYVKAL
jgi:SEC-C motif-containing protein